MSNEKIKALVVDDERPVLDFFIEASKRTNIEVTTVNNGKSAIEDVKENDFTIVFVDTRMPGMNGLDTLIEILKIKPDLPVFMMAMSVADEIFLESMKKGAKGVMYKPPDLDKVVTTIQRLEVIFFFKGELQRALERSKGEATEETKKIEESLKEAQESNKDGEFLRNE